MRDYVIVDCETFPIDDAEQYLEPLTPPTPPDLDAILPARNLVDPVKIADDIQKKRTKAVEDYEASLVAYDIARQERIDRCALDIDMNRIVVLGWMFPADPAPQVRVCKTATDERDTLETFWRDAAGHTLVTFGGLTFDLPVLMRRSLYLGVRYPTLSVDKYRSEHIDLLRTLTFNYAIERKYWHGLKFYLARFGIASEDMTTGADVAALVKANDWKAVAAHCEADVKGTRELALRIGALKVPQAA